MMTEREKEIIKRASALASAARAKQIVIDMLNKKEQNMHKNDSRYSEKSFTPNPTTKVDQMTLFSGLTQLISEHYPDLVLNTRHLNTLIKATQEITKDLNTPHEVATPDSGLTAWLLSDDVGESSKFLASKLSNIDNLCGDLTCPNYAHPFDVSDFNRCLKMLDAAPDLKPRLNKIAKESKTWEYLVSRWNDISVLINQENYQEANRIISKACDLY